MCGMFRGSRIASTFVAGLAVAMMAAFPAHAQSGQRFTGRLMAGGSQPAGGIKSRYDAGGLVGVQASYRVDRFLSITANSAWQNAPFIRADGMGDDATAWTYDVGLEGRTPSVAYTTGSWSLQPYLGAGFGGRSYDLSKTMSTSTTSPVSYGAIGADLNHAGMLGFRLEARDYFGSFSDPQELMPRQSGSDLSFALGVTLR